jgi:uncharacterized protein YkwD
MARTRTGWRQGWTAWALCVSLTGCGSGGAEPDAVTAAQASARGSASTLSEASLALAGAAGTPSDAALANELLVAVNQARASARLCGDTPYPAVGALRWHALAESAALAQAAYLQSSNQFSHTGANGSNVGDRLSATGYVWSTVGENLAAGYATVPEVVTAWLESPGHCANLMSAQFVDLGVARVPGTAQNTYANYWGMVLARAR